MTVNFDQLQDLRGNINKNELAETKNEMGKMIKAPWLNLRAHHPSTASQQKLENHIDQRLLYETHKIRGEEHNVGTTRIP